MPIPVILGLIGAVIQLVEWLYDHPQVTAPILVSLRMAKQSLSEAHAELSQHATPEIPEAP